MMMKDRIAFWGTDDLEKDILVTVRLRAEDNRVDIWTFPKETLDQQFVENIFQDLKSVDFDKLPQPHTHIEQDMSQPSLLPDNIKARNTDVINRAEKEWYVRVLSTKLLAKLSAEVEELTTQVKTLTDFDKEAWNVTQKFWEKVNGHYESRDLDREHAGALRDKLNVSFAHLKSLRKVESKQFQEEAKEVAEKIRHELEQFAQAIASKRSNLGDIFESLKKLQENFNVAKLSREIRNELREKINETFEAVKQARKTANNNRFQGRIDGLKKVVANMEKLIREDEKELQFQQNRISQSGGQLEIQLREAKILLVKSRLESKQEKLKDMQNTLDELSKRAEKEEQARIKAEEKAQSREHTAKEVKAKTVNKHDQANANADEKAVQETSAPVVAVDESVVAQETSAPVVAVDEPVVAQETSAPVVAVTEPVAAQEITTETTKPSMEALTTTENDATEESNEAISEVEVKA